MKQLNAILFLLVLFSCKAYCQSVSASFNMIDKEQTSPLKEKLFVHTDKTFYIAGEIIWFKIYCVEASSHQPLDLSKVAYIELLDSTNKPAAQAKIPLQKGTGNGSFHLPFALSSGNYTVRAYTSWMKNGKADDFFEKNVTIINIQKLTVSENKQQAQTVSIFFFPEGGSLVDNIRSRVAFKVVNQQGKSIQCVGTLKDSNDSLLSFSSHANGIGSFYFTPIKNHVYKAYIRAENGAVSTQTLPAAEENGFAMNTSDVNSNKFSVNVETNGVAAQQVYLIIHQNGKVVLAKENILQNNKTSFVIDTSLLPSGISTITLFNTEKQPVCERLFYKKYAQTPSINVTINDETYDLRKQVTISLHPDEKSFTNNDSASLSISVYRLDSLQSSDNNTIDTYLNLTSDLQSSVTNPQYYLYPKNQNQEAEMDELMIANGWRKLNTSKASEGSQPALSFIPEYKGHIVNGNIVNNITHLPEKNINVYLSVPGKGKQFYTALSDSLGNLKWETENWYGNAKMVAQTEHNDSSYIITVNEPFSSSFSGSATVPFVLPYSNPNTLLQHSIGMQTANIFSGNEMNRLIASPADSTPFFISPDKTYKLDDYSRFTTMEEVLREYIALVNVTKKKGSYHFPVYDFSGEKMFDDDPLVLVDGIPFFNLDSFITIDPMKLKKVDVVNRRYFYGNAIFDGILNWQTYSGDATVIDIDPKAVVIDYEGLQQQREFYSPEYKTEEQLNSHLPDFRSTLYWNPNIILKGNKTQQISFYTSDVPGKYVVIMQGVGDRGLYSGTTIFNVLKN